MAATPPASTWLTRMKAYKQWLLGGALALGLAAVAWGQAPILFNLTGSETVITSLPGSGAANPVPAYVLRSGANHQLVAAGTTVTTQVAAQSEEVLATGAITTWNINLPLAPYLGQKVVINCPGGTVSTLTLTATLPSGVAIVGTNPTSCTSGGAITNGSGWAYSVVANTWYRYQ